MSLAVNQILKKKKKEERLKEAFQIYEQDRQACEVMSQKGEALIKEKENILTYCNTGSLATGGIGTALGVIKQAHLKGKNIHVYVCETRPVNQGSRITFWELEREGIPATLICDNMAADLMQKGKIQKVFVGADRISQNLDVANKIGTLNLAVLSFHFKVPFYVVAPFSTWDTSCLRGQEMIVEQREHSEVSSFWAEKKRNIYNPSFDITPFSLVTKIITEKQDFS